ncbi:MAG TPA: ankyrin repeat domain-containing protein [Burkholderiaceae bacterium]
MFVRRAALLALLLPILVHAQTPAPAPAPSGDPAYDNLVAAIRADDPARVTAALEAGANPNTRPEGRSLPFVIAVNRGKTAVAQAMLAKGADINMRHAPYYNATVLMLAVNARNLEMVKLLLASGANPNLVDKAGDPALNWAIFWGDEAIVDQLLAHKADPTLFGHGNALHVAMRRGHQRIVDKLIAHMQLGAAPSAAQQRLLDAVRADDAQAVASALAAGANAAGVDATNRPVLSLAARLDRRHAASALLKAGAPVDAPDLIGFSPLMEAARDGHQDMADLLLRHGAKVDQPANANGLALYALHLAAAGGKLDLIRKLVASGARLDVVDNENATPLLWAINQQPPAAKLLLELGANPDIVSKDGDSPRKIAEKRDMKEILSVLPKPRQS